MGKYESLFRSLALLLMCYPLYLNLHDHWILQHYRVRKAPDARTLEECAQLKSLVTNSTRTMFDTKQFFQIVKTLQECPFVLNQTEISVLRSQLMGCCNASYSMIVTQENSPAGHIITFDGDRFNYNITEDTWKHFPQESPFSKPLRSCAVVGNGGILNGSSCGAEIDRADFVFRMNLPPLNWTDDVGTKTDLVTANPSILIKKFRNLRGDKTPFVDRIKAYGSPLVLIPAFSFMMNKAVSFRALETVEEFGLSSKVVFFNPDYLRSLTSYWRNKRMRFYRMSSGLMMVSTALEVCEEVTLYGFWPFSEDLNGVRIPHHYYDNVPPKSGMHAMPDEFYQYLLMYVRGSLRLNVAQCYKNIPDEA